jgi:hypothetical protein
MPRTDMQVVRPKRGVRVIHVETPLGIVNIHLGLRDSAGRRVENIERIGNNYAGEPQVRVMLDGRMVEELPEDQRRREEAERKKADRAYAAAQRRKED